MVKSPKKRAIQRIASEMQIADQRAISLFHQQRRYVVEGPGEFNMAPIEDYLLQAEAMYNNELAEVVKERCLARIRG